MQEQPHRAAASPCSTALNSPPPAHVLPCRRLLRAGADANAYDYDKRTALHVAAADGNLSGAKELVEKGSARADVMDRWGQALGRPVCLWASVRPSLSEMDACALACVFVLVCASLC
jgi:hypothetical protein